MKVFFTKWKNRKIYKMYKSKSMFIATSKNIPKNIGFLEHSSKIHMFLKKLILTKFFRLYLRGEFQA